MKTMSLELSLSAIGSSHATPNGAIGTHCERAGYIRSDTRCVFRSGLLTQVRRAMVELRRGRAETVKSFAARAEILAFDALRTGASADAVKVAALSRAISAAGWKSLSALLTAFLESLASMSDTTPLPEKEEEAQRMLMDYISTRTVHGSRSRNNG